MIKKIIKIISISVILLLINWGVIIAAELSQTLYERLLSTNAIDYILSILMAIIDYIYLKYKSNDSEVKSRICSIFCILPLNILIGFISSYLIPGDDAFVVAYGYILMINTQILLLLISILEFLYSKIKTQ